MNFIIGVATIGLLIVIEYLLIRLAKSKIFNELRMIGAEKIEIKFETIEFKYASRYMTTRYSVKYYKTVNLLHNNKIQCVLITVGPIQVAKVVATLWHFGGYDGSQYEAKEA